MAKPNRYLQVITTIDSQEGAQRLARLVVEHKVAGCAQIYGPITSVFWWKGAIEEAREWACVLKTDSYHYPALERLLKEHHSYTVPEILAVAVEMASKDYLRWLSENMLPQEA